MRKRPSPTWTVEPNTAAAELQPGASSSPPTRADPATARAPAWDTPCRTRKVGRVTRKLGRPVLTTSNPLTRPTASEASSEASNAGQVSHPAFWMSSAASRGPATARTPTERSNWPAMSSSPTATAPMPSNAAASSTLASPPAVSSAGAWVPRTATTTTRPTSAGRLGRARARPSRRRPRDNSTGAPTVGSRSEITGIRSGHRTTAAGPPRRTGGAQCPRPAWPPAGTRRELVSGGGRGPLSGLQPPAHAVVGVPGPAVHRPRIGHPVPDDACRVGGDLKGASAGLPGRPQRLRHDGDADGVHRAPVRADVDAGDLAVGDLDVVVVSLQTQPPAERAAAVAGRLDPAVVQQDATVVVPDEAELAWLSGADADVPGQADRGLV